MNELAKESSKDSESCPKTLPKIVTSFDQIKNSNNSLYDGGYIPGEINDPSIEFLAFSGGGMPGLSYIGVLKEFERRNMLKDVKYFVGSSSGAIISTLSIMGATYEYMVEKLSMVDIMSFFTFEGHRFDSTSDLSKYLCGYFAIPELIKNLGACSSAKFIQWFSQCMTELGWSQDTTFAELYNQTGKHLIITTTSLNTYNTLYLSRSSYPHMKVIDAMNASILLPFLFQPVVMDDPHLADEKGRKRVLIDGGALDNLPLNACDITSPEGEIIGFNRKAVGFLPVDEGRWCPDFVEVTNILQYGLAVIKTMHNSIHVMQSHQGYFWDRTVPIETYEVNTISFDISPEKLMKLIESGRRSASRYLDIREKMLREKGPLPRNLFIPNERLRCCGVEYLSDEFIGDMKIYQTNPANFCYNKIPVAHLYTGGI